MRHPGDGVLRRLADDPMMVPDADRRHVAACSRCGERLNRIELDMHAVARAMVMPRVGTDTGAALVSVRQRAARDEGVSSARWENRLPRRRMFPGVGVAAAFAALVGMASLSPARSLAQSFITIFQPKQIQVLPVTTSELSALPHLQQYGAVHMGGATHAQATVVGSASALTAASGIRLMTPSTLPSGVSSRVQYYYLGGRSASFQFSAARARQAAVASGKALPLMPAGIDGSTLQVTVGNTALAIYGASRTFPSLVVGEMQAPRIASTGVSVRELENYVLSLPGVPPQLATQLQSISDPTTTLPLLIPVDKAHARRVDVQGVSGLVVGDNTGLGSVVVWEKDNMMFGVGGTMSEGEAIAVANSLR